MLYAKFYFHGVFSSEAVLPPFKGSTFRGSFGKALKAVVCALRRENCQTCLLADRCLYSTVFENVRRPEEATGPSPVHPFVIEPPLTAQTHLSVGDPFDFGLLLFGRATEYLPYFLYAFEEMGRVGIGARLRDGRGKFRLSQVTYEGKSVYDSGTGKLTTGTTETLELENIPRKVAAPTTVTISLETPLRLKHNNRLHAELPFHVLVRAALRRVSTLNRLYGDGEPDLDYRGLVARAQQVRTSKSTIRWLDVRRYSNRQQDSMLVGGMIGDITYEGELAEFLPLIKYCEKVHLGKATTFGLGKIKVRESRCEMLPRANKVYLNKLA